MVNTRTTISVDVAMPTGRNQLTIELARYRTQEIATQCYGAIGPQLVAIAEHIQHAAGIVDLHARPRGEPAAYSGIDASSFIRASVGCIGCRDSSTAPRDVTIRAIEWSRFVRYVHALDEVHFLSIDTRCPDGLDHGGVLTIEAQLRAGHNEVHLPPGCPGGLAERLWQIANEMTGRNSADP